MASYELNSLLNLFEYIRGILKKRLASYIVDDYKSKDFFLIYSSLQFEVSEMSLKCGEEPKNSKR